MSDWILAKEKRRWTNHFRQDSNSVKDDSMIEIVQPFPDLPILQPSEDI